MRRFLVEPDQISNNKVSILGGQAKHLKQVLRINAGEKVLVLDGLGSSYLVQLEKVTNEVVQGIIVEKVTLSTESPLELTLVQSILKGDKMDLVVQKATEIGVSRIIPLNSERTVVRISGTKAEDRRQRWEKVAQEAVKQCGRSLVPEIAPIQDWPEVISQFEETDLILLPWEEEHQEGLKKILSSSLAAKRVIFFIGPEGGFTSKEVGFAKERGAQTVSLGPRILRAETASLAVAAVIMYTLGDLG